MRSVPAGRDSLVETLTPLVVEQAATDVRRRKIAERMPIPFLVLTNLSRAGACVTTRAAFQMLGQSRSRAKQSVRVAGVPITVDFRSMRTAIEWQCHELSNLSPESLYAAMQLRQKVFIVEQSCAYLDADGMDLKALHLLGWRDNNGYRKLIAYARLLPPRTRYAESSVGRVVTHPDARGAGVGRLLMQEAIDRIESSGWGTEIRIAAQMYLERFYERFGFCRVTEPYLEDDIWHVDMRRG